MKRDMELIRKIVFAVEDGKQSPLHNNFQIKDYSAEAIDYHCYLLVDGGYAEGIITTDTKSTQPSALIRNLTWQGHEFADLTRSQTVWKETMTAVKDRTETVGVGVLMQLLAATAKSMFGL